MKPRILTNSHESSFIVSGGGSRTVVLSPFSSARQQRRGDVYVVIDASTDPAVRRKFDEKIGRGMIREMSHVDVAHVKTANAVLASNTGFTNLSDAAPMTSAFCTPNLLAGVVQGLVPSSVATQPVEKIAEQSNNPLYVPLTQSGADPFVAAPSTSPIAGPSTQVEVDDKPLPDPRTCYRWENQAWKRSTIQTLNVGDIFKLREDDGSYVKNENGGYEHVCTAAPSLVTNKAGQCVWGVEAEAHATVKDKKPADKPAVASAPPLVRKNVRGRRSKV